jgi:hypothetical protein
MGELCIADRHREVATGVADRDHHGLLRIARPSAQEVLRRKRTIYSKPKGFKPIVTCLALKRVEESPLDVDLDLTLFRGRVGT